MYCQTRKIYALDPLGELRQQAGCVFVLCGTSSDSTTVKEFVFWKFDLKYLPCCLHPPDIPRSLEGAFNQQLTLPVNMLRSDSHDVQDSLSYKRDLFGKMLPTFRNSL